MAPNGDGELSTDQDLAELEATMERLGREKRACEEKIHSLWRAEDPGQGMYFAQEIFAAQQEKLRLQVEMDLCRAKKNRYLLAREWGQV
jgi:hypothetical protein